MKRSLKRMIPNAAWILALAGWVLRRLLYGFAVDEKNLLPLGHPLEILLWVVTAGAVALVIAAVWKLDGSAEYEDNFGPSKAAGVGHFAAAAGIILSVLTAEQMELGMLFSAWRVLGVLSAPALVWAGVSRIQGKKPPFLCHLLVCVFLLVHMVCHYRTWSGNPQLQDYLFDLLGCVALMLFAYYEAAFDVGFGKRRMQLAMGLLAVYFGFVALSGSQYPLLYLGGGVWAVSDLCSLDPKPKREGEKNT